MNNYYVYVYIDPRNFEEFYFGKGKGNRKEAHLLDKKASYKVQRIKEIRKEGLEPIIKVIAKDLTEKEAYLVEKTLLWKIGKWTTNISTGNFKENFRPANTLHKDISGFDFNNCIYFYNVGHWPKRVWEDYLKFNIISAGQNKRYKDAMEGFSINDVFLAYITGRGFVGIGKILSKAQMVRDVQIDGKKLLNLTLKAENMDCNCDNIEKSEYVCKVKWIKFVSIDEAVPVSKGCVFIPRPARASLEKHPETIKFFERNFDVNINEIMNSEFS